MPRLKLVSEEIVRWGFEVTINKNDSWVVAFTNPTAGPWKRILGEDTSGCEGEVHRFAVDEKRPDLVIFSDKYETVLIIEAKTDFAGLAHPGQIQKTCDLFLGLKELLGNQKENAFWGQRSDYKYELGLLWGKGSESTQEVKRVASEYQVEIDNYSPDILCIEGEFVTNVLRHRVFWGCTGKTVDLTNYYS